MFRTDFVCAGKEYNTYEKHVPAPVFRKDFEVSDPDKAMTVIIGATGFYELYLNGENITDGFLAPYISNSNDIVFYRKYELSKKLVRGTNTIAVILGNGFANPLGGEVWSHTERPGRASPAFTLDAGCFCEKDMKWFPSHILFDDERCGTFCDRRLECPEWYLPGFDDSEWHAPQKADTPRGIKSFVTCEPVRETETRSAVSIVGGDRRDYRIRDCFVPRLCHETDIMTPAPACGGFIYDFGENCAGVPILNIHGKAGQKIHLQFSEVLTSGQVDYSSTDIYPDGCCQQDIYICRGDKNGETYIPPFTYHGARYCYVHGITKEQATDELLKFAVLHNDVEKISDFSCDGRFVNEIYNACMRSNRSNLLHIITDCPAREKNGWTGDAGISAEQYMTCFNAENCFADFLACIRACMGNDGSLPLLLPSINCDGKSPVWDSVMVFLPYYAYIYRGNTDIINENCEAMMKNLSRNLSLKDERGIIECGLGDWLPVDRGADEYDSPLGFCATAVVAEMCRMCTVMFRRIGKNEYADFCEKERTSLIDAIRREYIDGFLVGAGKTEKYRNPRYKPCLTSQSMALVLGIFTDEEKEMAGKELLILAKEASFRFDCGFLGLRYLFHALTMIGESRLAYEMITRPEHPSYANMILRGETSVWERFAPPGGNIGSHNHHFLADVSSWFIKVIAGIRVNPQLCDPDCVYIDPQDIPGINEVKAFTKTPGGKVSIHIVRQNGSLTAKIDTEGNIKILLSENAKRMIG